MIPWWNQDYLDAWGPPLSYWNVVGISWQIHGGHLSISGKKSHYERIMVCAFYVHEVASECYDNAKLIRS